MSSCLGPISPTVIFLLLMIGIVSGQEVVQAEDIYIKRVLHTDSITVLGRAEPATEDTTEMWFSRYSAYSANSIGAVLVKTDSVAKENGKVYVTKMYVIDHGRKKYFEMPIANLGPTRGVLKQIHDRMESNMLLSVALKVVPAEDSMKIGEWNTKKYNLALTTSPDLWTMDMDYWVTEDLEVDHELLTAISCSQWSAYSGFEDAIEEMLKMKGVLVESVIELSIAGVVAKSSDKLLEYSKRSAPAGIYELPKDYDKIKIHPLYYK